MSVVVKVLISVVASVTTAAQASHAVPHVKIAPDSAKVSGAAVHYAVEIATDGSSLAVNRLAATPMAMLQSANADDSEGAKGSSSLRSDVGAEDSNLADLAAADNGSVFYAYDYYYEYGLGAEENGMYEYGYDTYDYNGLGSAGGYDDYYSIDLGAGPAPAGGKTKSGAAAAGPAAARKANSGKGEKATSSSPTPYQLHAITKMASFTEKTPSEKHDPVLAGPFLITWQDESTVNLKGSVTGLIAGKTYMVHIHEGDGTPNACKDAGTQKRCWMKTGGQFPEDCPWVQPKKGGEGLICQTTADKDGKATWDYTGKNAQPQKLTLGKVLVFHPMYGDTSATTFDPDNTPRMACGLVAEAKAAR